MRAFEALEPRLLLSAPPFPLPEPGVGGEPKRIYIALDDHTDLFWTSPIAEYEQAFVQTLDYYVARADETDDDPWQYQSGFSADGSYWMWAYERNRSDAEFEALIERIRSGHIKVPITPLVVSQGGMPAESVLRGMYYPGRIERGYDVRFEFAEACENPTYSLGLASLWAGSGAKYSWGGNWGGDTQIPSSELQNRDHEIFWWTGRDGRQILMKWPSLVRHDRVGGYGEARGNYPDSRTDISVDYVDTNAAFLSRYPYDIIGLFGYGHDDSLTTGVHFEEVAESLTTADRQVISSNMVDFFQDFDAWYGDQIPQVTASYGNEWDLYVATLAELSARVKRSTEQLRGAEALATLVSLEDPRFMDGRADARDQAWMNLGLYSEHDFNMVWTSTEAQQQRLQWQRQLVDQIESYVTALQQDAVGELGSLIQNTGSEERLFVFNPLSWARTDVADFEYDGPGPVHVIDLSTGQETPSQWISLGERTCLRIFAQDVPAVGYKVFETRPGLGQSFPDAAVVNGNVIENESYRITVSDRGAVTSLIDKTRGDLEMARDVGGRYINDLGAGSGTLTVENVGPVSVTLKAVASAPLAHTTRITLSRDSDRIDVQNEITQNFDDTYTWNYGFNLDGPDVWHEETGTVLLAKEVSEGGHYADRSARVDWLTLNHFADVVGDDGVGVTLSNADCFFMKLGDSDYTSIDNDSSQIQVLAGGRVGGDRGSGLRNQGGDDHFLQRFALRTHDAYDASDAMRFALAHQNPLITGRLTGDAEGPYDESQYSLLAISDPDVLLWALKPAEDGIEEAGVVARVWNLGDTASGFSLELAGRPILNASELTHVETPVAPASVSGGVLTGTAPQHGLQTYGLMPAASWNQGVVGRYVFYNGSSFDGGLAAANADDDLAIATDKAALRPGQTAALANYTSYGLGINGVMVDVVGLGDPEHLSAADFEFRTGNGDDLSAWQIAVPPQSVTVRSGAGSGGSDRVTLIWDDRAIEKQWLQITVLPTARTGLSEADVFYFGNAIGESGNSTSDAKVNAADLLAVRNNPRTLADPASIDFPYDHNRDERVNATDMLIARRDQTHFLTELRLITAPATQTKTDRDGSTASIERATVHDAVFAEVDGRESANHDGWWASFGWLSESERIKERQPSKADVLSENAITKLLAMP